jgi:hypothetical protein
MINLLQKITEPMKVIHPQNSIRQLWTWYHPLMIITNDLKRNLRSKLLRESKQWNLPMYFL